MKLRNSLCTEELQNADLWLLYPASPTYALLGLWNVLCALLGFGVRPILKERQCEDACPGGCRARNGTLLRKCILNTWAKSGAACPNDLLTGQHFHSRHCREEDSQAIEYFIFTWWSRFCMNYTKRINQKQSVLDPQLCLEICSLRHSMLHLLSSIFLKRCTDFFFLSPELCLTWSDWSGSLQCFIWVSAQCCLLFYYRVFAILGIFQHFVYVTHYFS